MKKNMRILVSIGIVTLLMLGMFGNRAMADDYHELKLTIQHYNFGDNPDKGSAVYSVFMSIVSLEPAGYPNRPTIQAIYDYGRTKQAAGPFNETTVKEIMNHFETDPDYNYIVIHSSDFDEVFSEIAYRINKPILDVPVDKAPIMIPLYGTFEDWVVVTGTRSNQDPYNNPDTVMYGLWMDDPKMYDIDEDEEPVETNIYYTVENIENNMYLKINNEYVAVVQGMSVTSCDVLGNEKNEFVPGQGVYIKASGLAASTDYKIWIQDDLVNEGDTLISGEDPSGEQEPVTTDPTSSFGPILIWDIPSDETITHHKYDVVVDKQGEANTGKYNAASDGIDSTSAVGFVAPIPELPTIILSSIGLFVLSGCVALRRKNKKR